MEIIGPIIVFLFFGVMLGLLVVLRQKILSAEKPGSICFFCGEPVTGTTHFDRWHSKTRRRLPSVYVCDECFDKHPMIVKIPGA